MIPNAAALNQIPARRAWAPMLLAFHRHEVPILCLSLLLGLVGLIAHYYLANYVCSILSVSAALACIYLIQNRDSPLVWLGNPIRFLLPAFIVFQLLGWTRCELIEASKAYVEHRWLWAGYAPVFGSEGCSLTCSTTCPTSAHFILCSGLRGGPARCISSTEEDSQLVDTFSSCCSAGFTATYAARANSLQPFCISQRT